MLNHIMTFKNPINKCNDFEMPVNECDYHETSHEHICLPVNKTIYEIYMQHYIFQNNTSITFSTEWLFQVNKSF